MYFEYRSHLIDSNQIQRIIFWWQYWLQASNINSNCEHFQTYRFLYIDDMASTCTGIQSVFDWRLLWNQSTLSKTFQFKDLFDF